MEKGSTEWEGPERRTSLRLRNLIDELQAGVRDNRSAIETVARRVADIAHDVEVLKNARP